jgi:hypothetical protein
VTKLEIANNEFGLKYRILRQEPGAKFLLFKDGPEPPMPENWLLDVQLASAVFKADQAAIWLAELGLPLQFEDGGARPYRVLPRQGAGRCAETADPTLGHPDPDAPADAGGLCGGRGWA